MANDNKIALVLGSGGARGLAHIGVIQALEEQGWQIASIAGSSMGALVGGLYAAGKLDDYRQWVCNIRRFDVLRLLDLSLGSSGLVKGERLIATLRQQLGDAAIEQLAIPFTAVATELQEGREIWLTQGSLFDAIRASIGIPLFFHPYQHQGRMLIDGGVINPVPLAPVFRDNHQKLIAVNLNGPALPPAELQTLLGEEKSHGLQQRLSEFWARLPRTHAHNETLQLGMLEVASQALELMQEVIARQRLAAYPPDLLVEIPRNLAGMLEFHRAEALINAGYQLAQAALARAALRPTATELPPEMTTPAVSPEPTLQAGSPPAPTAAH